MSDPLKTSLQKTPGYVLGWLALVILVQCQPPGNDLEVLGYRGIWFELNQKYPAGDKYSGGLGTYTAKHRPLAIYAETVNKTFFVYGGTTDSLSRHLLCMIGCYDHETHRVLAPTVVHDKLGVDDPHDNPSLLIDKAGFLWVFISGRGRKRPGFKYRSNAPYSIDGFTKISTEEMTYPQPWYDPKRGIFHFFTKYTGVRELYFETSRDGVNWTEDRKLAGIIEEDTEKAGHYQISARGPGRFGTFFSRHRDGHPDQRTDLYYLESRDFGQSWVSAKGETIDLPVTTVNNPALVFDFSSSEKNVYLKDMSYDQDSLPVGLILTSGGHEPGPENGPYQWQIVRWDGSTWISNDVTTSDHNYDMGSLFIGDSMWQIVAPFGDGPQKWSAGGEITLWQSTDLGRSWMEAKWITSQSQFNHGYIRKVHRGRAPFNFFWADGHGHEFSSSSLYFGDLDGQVHLMPYTMVDEQMEPVKISAQ